jgi:hypothetical protein
LEVPPARTVCFDLVPTTKLTPHKTCHIAAGENIHRCNGAAKLRIAWLLDGHLTRETTPSATSLE